MLAGTDTNAFMVNDTKFNEKFMQPEILLEGDTDIENSLNSILQPSEQSITEKC